MQYLLVDAHQRFLGTMICEQKFSVGDIFQNQEAKSYAVIGLNWSHQNGGQNQTLTVLPVAKRSNKANTQALTQLLN